MKRLFSFMLLVFTLAVPHPSAGAKVQMWGRPIQYWFDIRMEAPIDGPAPIDFQFAAAAIVAMGSNAVPFLVRVLEEKPSPFSDEVDKLKNTHPNGNWLLDRLLGTSQIKERRRIAADCLWSIGPAAGAAVPALMKALRDPDSGLDESAGQALEAMGDELTNHIPEIVALLNETNTDVLEVATVLAGDCGPGARSAVPRLLNLATNNFEILAQHAVEALWNVNRQTNAVLDFFSRISGDGPSGNMAFAPLASIGAAARPAIPVLLNLLASTNWIIREPAEAELRMLDPTLLQPTAAFVRSQMISNLLVLR